ncbi:MAG: hypothetical protein A3G20_01680 [Acidobacteria bacterium RIFCSPLOWO2_12_FULL_59_11]|nr:MAG: hypothetical protein A3G20_01680 [Acidobacteria bacterium RIFCSPLOWO2_12_FULL_59_11]
MAAITKGITISFSNTPQATDDTGVYGENQGIAYFNVLSNDLGGNAKTLYSVDDGTDATFKQDLLSAQKIATSALGADISVVTDTGSQYYGQIAYDAQSIFDYLAEGESATDTFAYAIRLSSGALSWATMTVTITGSNDGPVISVGAGDSAAETLVETNAGLLSLGGTLTVVDVDLSDTVTPSVVSVVEGGTTTGLGSDNAALAAMLSVSPATIDADTGNANNLAWSFSSTPEAFDYLADGESLTLTYTVRANVGYVPGFPGAHSQGATLDELHANLQEVITLLLDDGEPKLQAEFVGTQTVVVD